MNELHVETLCIGSTFSCLLYSLKTGASCILNNPQKLFRFSNIVNEYDFNYFETDQADVLWDRICFLLSMSGNLLFPNNIQSFRKEKDHVKIITHYNKKTIIHYDKLVEFDTKKTGYLSVYDYFWGRVGSSHEVDLIEDDEDFINKIIFYPRQEKPNTKDLVCVSKVRESELNNFNNSPNYARLKAIGLMRANGVKGIKTGMQNGKPSYVPPKIEWEKRDVHYCYESDITFDEVYRLKQEDNYAWKLLKNMTRCIFTSQE